MRTRLQKPKKMVIAKFSVLFANAKLYFSSWGKQGLIHDIRYFCTRFRIDGVKAMSCGGGKQVIKFANTSNRGRVCLFSQKETTILGLKNVQFELPQVLRHHCLL